MHLLNQLAQKQQISLTIILDIIHVCVSGDWAEYWSFHLQQEHQRNHQALYQGDIPLLNSVSQAHCSIASPPKLMLV